MKKIEHGMLKDKQKGKKAVKRFAEAIGNNLMGTQLVGELPYMIGIYEYPSGIIVYGNKKFFENYEILNPDDLIGKYSILQDEYLLDTRGAREFIERVFKGETLILNNYKTPYEVIRVKRNKEVMDEFKIHDVTGYPIYNKKKEIAYLVFTSHIVSTHSGRKEIMKAQEYLIDNWLDDFNLEAVAKSSGLSVAQFSRMFKHYVGKTPYEYYKQIKIDKLKERLLDPNLSISDAFADCGIDYNGRYRQFFKAIVGKTPREYWESNANYEVVE